MPAHAVDEANVEVFKGGKCGQGMYEISGKILGIKDWVVEVPREH
jgi:hypothetical protein